MRGRCVLNIGLFWLLIAIDFVVRFSFIFCLFVKPVILFVTILFIFDNKLLNREWYFEFHDGTIRPSVKQIRK